MKRSKYQRRSITQFMKQLLFIVVLVLTIYAGGNALLLQKIKTQTLRDIDEVSQLYTNELDSKFLRISRKLFATVMERRQSDSAFWTYVNMMLETTGNIEYPVGKLRDLYLSSIWEYGQEFQMFLYLEERHEYWHLSMNNQGWHAAPEMVEQAMIEQIRGLETVRYSVKKKWNIVECNGETYMCKIAQVDGVSLGCFVNIKDILAPFSEITMGKNGYVSLVDEAGMEVAKLTDKGISSLQETENEVPKVPCICKELSQAPFEIQMCISSERIMGLIMGSVTMLFMLGIFLICSLVWILFITRQRILGPVQAFVKNLEYYGEEEVTFNITESNLLELEQIDDKFKHMIHQIRRLKITLYEQELENQRIEMDYLKLQIRPHFYLNCLNFIYSMIDFKKYDYAKQMSQTTADYISYIFRNVHELVPVQAEKKHCEDYLKILLLRYPDQFEYYIELQEEVEDALIFPFLIQVFVENASKHALTLSEKILISVTVYPEEWENEKYINIYISDTGHGFPPDILEKLKNDIPLSVDGQHIGIDNCKKRFQYYYKDKGKINFYNSPLGGAIIDIHIPFQRGI